MRRLTFVLAALLAVTLAPPGATALAGPAADPPVGTVSGRVTTEDGAPATGVVVWLYPAGNLRQAWTTAVTDANGDYRMTAPPGSYNVAFTVDRTAAAFQWSPRRRTFTEATRYELTDGGQITVDERLLPLGVVRGRFTRDGEPVARVTVSLGPPTPDGFLATPFAFTGADGAFRLWLFPGEYILWFRPDFGQEQWSGGTETRDAATPVTVTAGAEVVLEERQLPTGRVQGRLVEAAGQPVEGASVQINNPSRDRFYQTSTNSDGAWSANVAPGEYVVAFRTEGQAQWATGASVPEDADPVTVTAGGTTVVDEVLLPTGSLTVAAVDARTGAPVNSFCVDAQSRYVFHYVCAEDGTVEMPRLGAGSYDLIITGDDFHFDRRDDDVRVTAGATTTHVARLAPAGVVAVTATDAASGDRVGNACARLVPVDRPTEPEEYFHNCDSAGEGGFTVTRVRPGRYALFATAHDGEHGAQWVGPRGGVGALAAARVLTVSARATTAVTVRYDGAGAVAGTVTARSGGHPVADAEVGVGSVGVESFQPPRSVSTDADGRYLLDGLGPYRWTLYTSHPEYASQWSGGGSSRLTATPVPVRAGDTTTFDVALRAGTILTGTLRLPDGQVPGFGAITIVDADTYDQIASVTTVSEGRYTVHYTGPVRAAFAVTASTIGGLGEGWHRQAADFPHARVVRLPAGGTPRLDLTAPAPVPIN
jgi:5-hydroxyisourate hydrolase-like protein (transthyretin family)